MLIKYYSKEKTVDKKIDLWSVVEELTDDQIQASGSGCHCGCYYVANGGSGTSANMRANKKNNLHS